VKKLGKNSKQNVSTCLQTKIAILSCINLQLMFAKQALKNSIAVQPTAVHLSPAE